MITSNKQNISGTDRHKQQELLSSSTEQIAEEMQTVKESLFGKNAIERAGEACMEYLRLMELRRTNELLEDISKSLKALRTATMERSWDFPDRSVEAYNRQMAEESCYPEALPFEAEPFERRGKA